MFSQLTATYPSRIKFCLLRRYYIHELIDSVRILIEFSRPFMFKLKKLPMINGELLSSKNTCPQK